MHELTARVLNASRKRWFGTRPLFTSFKAFDVAELERAERKVAARFPEDLKSWLFAAGYGDVDEKLSFRYDWLHKIEIGRLAGFVVFAQDELGNFYAFEPADGGIFFLARSSPEYAKLASSFREFMEELERRDFQLEEWVDGLKLMPSEGDA